MDFDLTSALQNKMQSDPDAAHRLGLIENNLPEEDIQGEKLDDEERLKQCRALVNELLTALKEKRNPIAFFHNRNAQIALSQLDVAEQAAFWVEAKDACPRLNLVDARRAVREASGHEQKKKSGLALSQGLIQQHGCYLTQKMTADGPMQVSISNFTTEPVQKILTYDGRSILKVNVFIGGSESPTERYLSPNDLLGRKELLKAISCVDAQWTGNDQNVQMLVGHMANVETPTKYGVPYVGFYKDRFVTPEVILTDKGPEQESQYVYIPQDTTLERHIHFPYCKDWPALARKILGLIPYIQPPSVIWSVAGWFFACPVSQQIRKIFNEFPILLCWGTGGSGKTSIIILFLSMLGILIEPLAAMGKEFVLIKNLSATNALPIPLDEYRPNQDPKKAKVLHEKLLLCYKASIDERGRPDQRTNKYPLMAPVVLAGESPLPETETGLMERVLQIRFDKNFIDTNPDVQEKFNELISLPLPEFAAGYVTWLMKWDVEGIFRTALNQTNKILGSKKVAPRIRHNLATTLVGIILFTNLAKEVGAQLPKINLEPAFHQLAGDDFTKRKEPRNAVDRFMLHMADMTHTGEIHSGVDFILNEDDPEIPKLVLCTAAIQSAQMKYCKARGLESQVVSDKALRVMLEERLSDYILVPYGLKARIGAKSIRATVISAKRLEERLDIDIDTWRSSRKENLWNTTPDDDKPKTPDRLRDVEELFNEK